MKQYEAFGIIPVEFRAVAEVIGQYNAPNDKIRQMEQAGTFIRLKKGLYVLSNKISHQPLSKELIANHLMGPSYVSLESALSYFGLIPERVLTCRSVTIKRSKTYNTRLGVFEYITMPDHNYYSIGISYEIINNSYAFLIATPEKAICDLIVTTPYLRIQSKKAMAEYLYEDLRIDNTHRPDWNLGIIEACRVYGRKKRELNLLYQVLKNG